MYDFITKLCGCKVDVPRNHDNETFATLDEAKRNTDNSRRLNLAAVKRFKYPL